MYRQYKGVLILNKLKQERNKTAAIVIQCFRRRIVAMRLLDQMLLEHLELVNNTAITLQKYIRRYLAMCTLDDLKYERNENASIVIQTCIRKYLAICIVMSKRKEKQDKVLYDASLKIQCIIRGALARKYAHQLRVKKAKMKAQQQRAVEALAMIKSGHKWGQARKRIDASRQQHSNMYQNPKPAWGIISNNKNNKNDRGSQFANFVGSNSIMGITPTRPTSNNKNKNSNIGKSPRKMKANHVRKSESVMNKKKMKHSQNNINGASLPKIKRPIIGNSTKSKSAPMQSVGRAKMIATTKLKLHSKNKKAKHNINSRGSSNKGRSPRVRNNGGGRMIRGSNGAGGKSLGQQNSAVNWFTQ